MVTSYNNRVVRYKKVIWLYIIFLLFEGAIRKWIFPGLEALFLIIRDPLGLYLVFNAFYFRILVLNFYFLSIIAIGIISFFTALLFGHQNIAVALYGIRIFLIHLPLIFIIGRIFSNRDVLSVGRFFLKISIPMTVLLGLQYFSPQSSFLNRGVGGDVNGSGFSGAMGFFRSSCTFSFTNGTALFYSLVACFVFYFWTVNDSKLSKAILWVSTVCLFISIPLSISRTLLFQVIISLGFTLIVSIRSNIDLTKAVLAFIIALFASFFIIQLDFVAIALEVFITRITEASISEGDLIEGSLIERFVGSFVRGITKAQDYPFWGYGLGIGSNVGAKLLSGTRGFMVAEEEWSRVTGEMGFLLGLLFLYWRVKLSTYFLVKSFKYAFRKNKLPWCLCSVGLIGVVQAQLAQPTSLGFVVLTAGIILASFREEPLAEVK